MAASEHDYAVVPNIFTPSDQSPDASHWNYIDTSYGIINRSYPNESKSDASLPQWTRLNLYIAQLSKTAPSNTKYKLLFLARHGEGDHNVAETKYGTKAWDDYWSKLEGDGELFWSDAHLTKRGEAQATSGGDDLWSKADQLGLPWPQAYYSSPLARCLQTSTRTFAGLKNRPADQAPFRPTVKEMLRETNGVHTCDRRSSVTALREAFPAKFMDRFVFEPGFSDEDGLWSATERETDEEVQTRARVLLEDLFSHDDNTVLSLTSHSGWIKAALVVLGHRAFSLDQGSAIAVLVKATKR